ncbi:hypothetical protein BCR34DRAFT_42586 [Clohesyomyces aquaticus]|uniref:Uncharacterized protein n=1 Tax=Clohesyomyces aquaticus TaxID=1231657 RepID=A0A1Y1Z6G4_9PLEO|nr:hypothetical protein BCR34DRAFT_42586 [Clohesyomyces aquaticus]
MNALSHHPWPLKQRVLTLAFNKYQVLSVRDVRPTYILSKPWIDLANVEADSSIIHKQSLKDHCLVLGPRSGGKYELKSSLLRRMTLTLKRYPNLDSIRDCPRAMANYQLPPHHFQSLILYQSVVSSYALGSLCDYPESSPSTSTSNITNVLEYLKYATCSSYSMDPGEYRRYSSG